MKWNGQAQFRAIPSRIEPKKIIGGRSKPGFGPCFIVCALSVSRRASMIVSFALPSSAKHILQLQVDLKSIGIGRYCGHHASWEGITASHDGLRRNQASPQKQDYVVAGLAHGDEAKKGKKQRVLSDVLDARLKDNG